jgi:hypothetical protein
VARTAPAGVDADRRQPSFDRNESNGIEMKHIVFALSLAILTLVGCSTTPDGSTSQALRTELQPGYWDPK